MKTRHRMQFALALAGAVILAAPAQAHMGDEAPEANADADAACKRPDFESLRYEEDWSFLRDPAQRTERLDALKYVPLNRSGDRYLTLGGEARPMFESYSRDDFGGAPRDANGYFLQRYALHGDLHLGPRLRFFGQLFSGLEAGKRGGPDPSDENRLELHQWFVDFKARASKGQVTPTLRLGRQEMEFGSNRLISAREGPNVRRSFQGVRATLPLFGWRVDGFATRPVEDNRGSFDDGALRSQSLSGLYAIRALPFLPGGNLDLYLLRNTNNAATFASGTDRERRLSAGARLWGERKAQRHALDYNFEAVAQRGRFGDNRIRAWTAASDTGITWPKTRFSPRLGLRADIASGDRNPNDQTLGTFNGLFPQGDYFGESRLLGPSNFVDMQPSLALQLNPRLSLTSRYTAFWRQSTRDGIYNPPGNLLRPGDTSRARFVGSEASFLLEWQRDRHTTLAFAYSRFFAGRFLRESGAGLDVNYVQLHAAYKF